MGLRSLKRPTSWLGMLLAAGLLSSLLVQPAIAQIMLSQAPASPSRLRADGSEVQGTTAGSYSLTQLAARDRRRKLCLGYGTQDPSHLLELEADQGRLQIRVESGNDTTLLIQGPNGIDCNDNYTRDHRDAAITRSRWPAGLYRIWVGSFDQGDQVNYRLRVISSESAER